MHLLKLGLSPTEYQVNTNSKGRPAAEKLGLPPANVIGSIFHRVVEIGLQTPKIEFELSTPLPTQWTQPSPDLLADDEVIKSVLKELMPPDADADALRTLLKQMSEAVKQGPLGTLTSGASWNKRELRGCVRSGHSVYRFRWSSMLARSCGLHTAQSVSHIDEFMFSVSGIADLVLCTQMDNGKGAIRAVDLKTTGQPICLQVGLIHFWRPPVILDILQSNPCWMNTKCNWHCIPLH